MEAGYKTACHKTVTGFFVPFVFHNGSERYYFSTTSSRIRIRVENGLKTEFKSLKEKGS